MPIKPLELIEFFHLTLLRHLSARLSGRDYALKGGVCLRLFHRSPRLSQDMDFDVISNLRKPTLEKAVDSILLGRPLLTSLYIQGITGLKHTKPKQTETTQRWKVNLRLGETSHVWTKVEFSRRRDELSYATGQPDPTVLSHHKVTPFSAHYYDATAMAIQKVTAISSPTRYAVRDLFDIHHIILTLVPDRVAIRQQISNATADQAARKIDGFTYRDFESHVGPYLTGSLMDLYRDPSAFETLKTEVLAFLKGAER